MFKQLSQFGKNISDEIARGLNEEFSTSDPQSPGQNTPPSNYDELPRDIQAKLKKFDKYEQKYPLLLNAYKAEKEKSQYVDVLLKILSENTPLSSLNDAESLRGYFSDVNTQISMLNDEIKRLTGENNAKTKEINELKNKQEVTAEGQKDNNADANINELKEVANAALEELKEGHLRSIKEKDMELEKLQVVVREAEQNVQNLESTLQEKNAAIVELEANVKNHDEKILESEKLITMYKDTIQKLSQESIPTSVAAANKPKGKRNRGKKTAHGQSSTPPVAEEEGKNANNPSSNVPLRQTGDDIIKSIETKVKYEEMNKELSAFKALGSNSKEVEERIEKLQNELSSTKSKLKSKTEELETVSDMLKTVGSELVEFKDQMKEQNNTSNEIQTLKSQLEKANEEKGSIEKQLTERLSKLQQDKNALEKAVSEQSKKFRELEQKYSDSVEQINNLKAQSAEWSEKLREFSNLKKSESMAKLTLSQKEKTILYLEQQIKEYTSNGLLAQKAVDDLTAEKERLLKRIELLNNDLERTKSEIKKNDSTVESYIKENGKLSERLEVLQEKFDSMQSMKSNSSEQVDSIRRQCEELSTKLREANKRILSLEDEVNENANILQERIREANTMRKLLNDDQINRNSNINALEAKIATLTEERDRLSSELEFKMSSSNREVKQLIEANMELKSQVHNLTLKSTGLDAELQQLRELNSTIQRRSSSTSDGSGELEKMVRVLKGSLSSSEKKCRELKTTNGELRTLNDDLVAKLDRISKNYKALSNQLQAVKERRRTPSQGSLAAGLNKSSRSQSVSSQNSDHDMIPGTRTTGMPPNIKNDNPESESALNDKIAYIKNVLLGFLEYRDQRTQLLPIVSMLLHLDSNDERKLMMSLK
ncbi:HHL170Wp [Eremothecium sinecaudum]|uniref:HHL170Wp n=1 Tax=Eremothecium sinecaudum TaxID=45286 RepID=A0A0X8HW67_9SACH|nr:HHL170Wp [Eremothecium sinecaudum]AMD22600.1 HHL170Wp [Eremothecium sinecaudum]